MKVCSYRGKKKGGRILKIIKVEKTGGGEEGNNDIQKVLVQKGLSKCAYGFSSSHVDESWTMC